MFHATWRNRGIVFPRSLVNHAFPERAYLSQFSGWNKFRQLWENFGKSPKVKSSHVVSPAAQAFTRRKRSRDLPGEAYGRVTTSGGEQLDRRRPEEADVRIMSQHCQQLSMLEIAKNLLLCQNRGEDCDLDCLTAPRETERAEKLKFKLIGLQLVNQIFCRKLRKQREESERLDRGGKDDQNIQKSPRLSFREVYDGECLKSLVAIRFEDSGHQVADSEKEHESVKSNGDKKDKFIAREKAQMRSASLKNYRRRFSTKNLKSGDRRHHSLKLHRKDLKPTSCPDLHESLSTEGRLQAYDSVDDFTTQLFAEHILPSSQEDLLSICFE